jgi:hypothetical protein
MSRTTNERLLGALQDLIILARRDAGILGKVNRVVELLDEADHFCNLLRRTDLKNEDARRIVKATAEKFSWPIMLSHYDA